MASLRVVNDVARLERLVDPLKIISLEKSEEHTESKAEGPRANVDRRPSPGQLEPVPPPTGELCIFRKHWANLENGNERLRNAAQCCYRARKAGATESETLGRSESAALYSNMAARNRF